MNTASTLNAFSHGRPPVPHSHATAWRGHSATRHRTASPTPRRDADTAAVQHRQELARPASARPEQVLARDAAQQTYDRGAAVKEAGLAWTSLGRYELRARGPGVIVPMDMLRDITPSGVVGDATRARVELGERMVAAIVPRIVQVCREMARKEQ